MSASWAARTIASSGAAVLPYWEKGGVRGGRRVTVLGKRGPPCYRIGDQKRGVRGGCVYVANLNVVSDVVVEEHTVLGHNPHLFPVTFQLHGREGHTTHTHHSRGGVVEPVQQPHYRRLPVESCFSWRIMILPGILSLLNHNLIILYFRFLP